MSGSAQRARRLVSGGWVLLATPVVWLVAASLFLTVQPVRLLTPLVWVVTVLWVGNLVAGLVGAAHRRPRPADRAEETEAGVAVTPEDQPDLWRLVRDAAHAARVEPPEELRLTAAGQVAAWSGKHTRLDLGVPVLYVLDRDGVGALVARALHVARSGWTETEETVDRFRWLLRAISGRHLPSGVARQLLGRLERQRAEGMLEADDVATRVAGRPAAGRALAWAHVARTATQWWHDEYVAPELHAGGHPRPLLPGLEALLGDPQRQRRMMGVVSSGLPGGEGTVPGLADRVYGLQTGAELPDLLPGAPAVDLLRAPSTLLSEVAEASVGPVGSPRTWSQALDSWATRTSQSCTAILTERAPDLGAVLTGVEEKRLEGWVRDAVRDPGADAEDLACFLLTGRLVSALVDAGVGRAVAGWSGSLDVVARDGSRFDLPLAARTVVEDPDLVPELRRMLRELEVPLDRRPTGEARPGLPLLAFHRETGPRRLPGTGFPGLARPS